MDSRALVSQMQELGLWPEDETARGTIAGLFKQFGADTRGFARELMQRDHLTAYQVNAIFAGKARQITVGPYLVLERLGEGGMGQVFKARHRRMHRVVALKVIRPERVANPISVERFYREVQAAGQLAHPNIVRAYDAGKTEETYYMAMQYIKGIDLSAYVKHHGPLRITQACGFLAQAASGLQHINEHGMVHRDVKPGNMILEEVADERDGERGAWNAGGAMQRSAAPAVRSTTYQLRILDLGLARLCEDDALGEHGNKLGLTQEGAVMGTADYMAPEQARNSREADIRSDIYSLGCTFYYALAGKVPFPGGTAMEKMLHHQMDEPAPLESQRPDMPVGLAAILRLMMAKDPAQRFQTPAEVVTAVAPWCEGGGPPPMAIPLSQADLPTLSDLGTGQTDEPVVFVDRRRVPSRTRNLLAVVISGALLVAFTGAAVLLFMLLRGLVSK